MLHWIGLLNTHLISAKDVKEARYHSQPHPCHSLPSPLAGGTMCQDIGSEEQPCPSKPFLIFQRKTQALP